MRPEESTMYTRLQCKQPTSTYFKAHLAFYKVNERTSPVLPFMYSNDKNHKMVANCWTQYEAICIFKMSSMMYTNLKHDIL